jgi:hypothetical protein
MVATAVAVAKSTTVVVVFVLGNIIYFVDLS